jgi:hypothetical protein
MIDARTYACMHTHTHLPSSPLSKSHAHTYCRPHLSHLTQSQSLAANQRCGARRSMRAILMRKHGHACRRRQNECGLRPRRREITFWQRRACTHTGSCWCAVVCEPRLLRLHGAFRTPVTVASTSNKCACRRIMIRNTFLVDL